MTRTKDAKNAKEEKYGTVLASTILGLDEQGGGPAAEPCEERIIKISVVYNRGETLLDVRSMYFDRAGQLCHGKGLRIPWGQVEPVISVMHILYEAANNETLDQIAHGVALDVDPED